MASPVTHVVDAETGEHLVVPLKRPPTATQRGTTPGEREGDSELASSEQIAAERKAQRQQVLLALQRRQHETLQAVVEEEVAAEKQREVQWRSEAHLGPAAQRLLRSRFTRERAAARERLERLRHEHELILVAKMAELNLLR
mmetsp:Transcript_1218/g.3535  ORF Transcript_1218/g.3535 Transcript_1218/m.3535 type:complete len:142 (-) Transcript_1218:512-937(-)|eukprot:CAMPEP_0202071794 /NCGR_PEP_ID=MMETSP0964-20121228/2023_1 /ASSEMBLY_ACC=CAM_ASM_000500 /TAXON_ID=4773 /ORGANISM="Schizochytrium aggregatum, Strain ATCC28209" /LENGTH=141 /DNA_ID=CAMNT_0048638793 /DNA_START=52 /DNA_END=477 /DNA_ORIENTATION=-